MVFNNVFDDVFSLPGSVTPSYVGITLTQLYDLRLANVYMAPGKTCFNGFYVYWPIFIFISECAHLLIQVTRLSEAKVNCDLRLLTGNIQSVTRFSLQVREAVWAITLSFFLGLAGYPFAGVQGLSGLSNLLVFSIKFGFLQPCCHLKACVSYCPCSICCCDALTLCITHFGPFYADFSRAYNLAELGFKQIHCINV